MSPKITFVFQNNKAYAFSGGEVVASANSIEELEHKVAMNPQQMGEEHPWQGTAVPHAMDDPDLNRYDDYEDYENPGAAPCVGCGTPGRDGDSFCPACGTPVDGGQGLQGPQGPTGGPEEGGPYGDPGDDFPDHGPVQANVYVTTPGGLRGKVLGKQAGLWSDELTVRLENGRIIHVDVVDGMKFAKQATASTEDSPTDTLRQRLASTVEGDRASLDVRATELEDVRRTASALISSASEEDAAALSTIHSQAGYELSEIKDVVAHLDAADYEGFVPTAPFTSHVVEQESLGVTANWLDGVADDMIKEASSTDFAKLLEQEPTAFVASLDTAPLADAGVVREVAASHVRTFTAAATADVREPFEAAFLERVEQARRVELASRKETVAKHAATVEASHTDAPDEALFL